jgi:serine/threonine protein kinase
MSDPNCPSHEELAAYALGKLADEDSQAIDNHVDTCHRCPAVLEMLQESHDSLLAGLRLPVEDAAYVDEPQCRDALTRAKAVAADAGTPAAGVTDQLTADSTVLGEYQLLEKLGEGGMGTVYKARHTKLKRVVALKVMSKRRLGDDRAIIRFEREMEAVGQLDHPNIVRALDAREVDKVHFLVMELVEGMDLSELVARLGPLPIPDACELVRQAGCGLQYAHEHGMIHRDIKPSNLMLTESPASSHAQRGDQGGHVKILDLGLARLHGPQSEAAGEITDSGQMMGTLNYMAPEQGTDSHQVDERADIYSLGATLYKLLTGHSPFSGKEYNTPVKKMMALATEPIPAIRERHAGVPDELTAVLDRMLARNPDDRFPTPADAGAAAEHVHISFSRKNKLQKISSSVTKRLIDTQQN